MVHEHWDGSSRPRNVNYATRRLGDHEPYFSYGSGGPGDVSRGRRGRLEVTLRSYSSVLEYAPERVNDLQSSSVRQPNVTEKLLLIPGSGFPSVS